MRLLAVAVKLGFVVVGLGLLSFNNAGATGSTVTVVVCRAGLGSQVVINQPATDSTVNQPTLAVSGTVSRATQIDVRVDGTYSQTVPLGVLQQVYSFPLTLTEGTHTISLVANDECGVSDGTAQAVITYQPQIIPETGSETTTSTGQLTTGLKYTDADTISLQAAGSQVISPKAVTTPQKHYGVTVLSSADGLERQASFAQLVVDSAKPSAPIAAAPVVVAVPFVAGAGSFGWWGAIKVVRLLKGR